MQYIDITHTLHHNTPVYPGDTPLSLVQNKFLDKDFYCEHYLQTNMHVGTHIDMPMHLVEDNRTVADFQLEHFVGQGVVLDVRGESCISMKPIYKDLIREGNIVLLYTGWDKFFQTEKYFSSHPAISKELSDFFIHTKIKMLGMDMPSPDHTPFKIHKDLLAHNILILENLTNLHPLLGKKSFEVMAFPLNIQAEASLVRVVCQVQNYMQGLNIIAVYDYECKKLLMCKRRKNPYIGLSNLVGGKIEKGEAGIEGAYRELFEETSITKNDIRLTHLMDFTYHLDDCYVEVYVGRLNKPFTVSGDENELYWSDLDCDFFSMTEYAGEGNIGHLIEHIKMSKERLLSIE